MGIQEYAGKNLWLAIVEQALHDFQKATGAKKEAIRREIEDPWFSRICSNADIDHGCILAILDREEVLIPPPKFVVKDYRNKWGRLNPDKVREYKRKSV
jgi:hypothetical protein